MLNPVQQAVYHCVHHFINRQAIVLQALYMLRPELAFWGRGMVTPGAKWSTRKKVQPSGKWQEWEYYLHGRGCRLVHLETSERLEWDIGPLCRFDKSWFLRHLEWQASHQPDADTELIMLLMQTEPISLEKFIYAILEELAQQHLLAPESYRYNLMIDEE